MLSSVTTPEKIIHPLSGASIIRSNTDDTFPSERHDQSKWAFRRILEIKRRQSVIAVGAALSLSPFITHCSLISNVRYFPPESALVHHQCLSCASFFPKIWLWLWTSLNFLRLWNLDQLLRSWTWTRETISWNFRIFKIPNLCCECWVIEHLWWISATYTVINVERTRELTDDWLSEDAN